MAKITNPGPLTVKVTGELTIPAPALSGEPFLEAKLSDVLGFCAGGLSNLLDTAATTHLGLDTFDVAVVISIDGTTTVAAGPDEEPEPAPEP